MNKNNKIKALLVRLVLWIIELPIIRHFKHSCGDWRYLYLPFFWKLSNILVPRRLVIVGDVSFTLPCDNWITHFRWYLFKTKEVEVREYIDNYVKDDDIFFDIGANIGVFSIYACKRHEKLKTYCFEPEYSNLHYLKENVIKNRLMDSINIYSVAVSNDDMISMLNVQDLTPGAAVHTESKENIEITDEGYDVVWREGISTITLDRFCSEENIFPDVMKIDTDGNEAKILAGASNVLMNKKLRSIVLELPLDPTIAEQCVGLLKNAGFSLEWSRDDTRNQIWARSD